MPNYLYYVPTHGELLKIQAGTGDNLLPEDMEAGYTDYVLVSTFRFVTLGIDGELETECLNSSQVMLKGNETKEEIRDACIKEMYPDDVPLLHTIQFLEMEDD